MDRFVILIHQRTHIDVIDEMEKVDLVIITRTIRANLTIYT